MTKHPDVQADAFYLPFTDQSFQAVICAELLEHVQNPVEILREVFRVLCPDGSLLITVPFLYRVHGDPYDFGRYTDYFWQQALSEIGFDRIVVEQQGMFYTVLTDFIKQYFNVRWRRPLRWAIQWPLTMLQQWALSIERKPATYSDPFLRSFTTGYGIVAVKPCAGLGTQP
jgi:SAM-dependent methyltransferase